MYRIRSPGRRTNPSVSCSITQLFCRARNFFSILFFVFGADIEYITSKPDTIERVLEDKELRKDDKGRGYSDIKAEGGS